MIEPRRKQKSTAYRGRQRGLETSGRGAEKIPWKRLADAREGLLDLFLSGVIRAAELKKLDHGDIGVKKEARFPGALLLHCCLLSDPSCRAKKGGIFARHLLKSAQNLGFLSCSWSPVLQIFERKSTFLVGVDAGVMSTTL